MIDVQLNREIWIDEKERETEKIEQEMHLGQSDREENEIDEHRNRLVDQEAH